PVLGGLRRSAAALRARPPAAPSAARITPRSYASRRERRSDAGGSVPVSVEGRRSSTDDLQGSGILEEGGDPQVLRPPSEGQLDLDLPAPTRACPPPEREASLAPPHDQTAAEQRP